MPVGQLGRLAELRLRVGTPSVFAVERAGRLRLDVMALLPGDELRLLAAFGGLPAPCP